MVSSMARRTCWPLPVRSRAKSAAVIACAAVSDVVLSGTMVRTMWGRPVSLSVWMSQSPQSAWMTES